METHVRGSSGEHNRQPGRYNLSPIRPFYKLDMSETEMDPWALMVKANEGRLSFHPSELQLNRLETNISTSISNTYEIRMSLCFMFPGQGNFSASPQGGEPLESRPASRKNLWL